MRDIVDAVCSTADELRWKFPELKAIRLTREPTFITTQELEDLYPDLTPKSAKTPLPAPMAPSASCRSAAS